jgi:hypothetical protein
MDTAKAFTHADQADLITRLTQSRDRLLTHAAAGTHNAASNTEPLYELATTEITLTLDLHPLPRDPSACVRRARMGTPIP